MSPSPPPDSPVPNESAPSPTVTEQDRLAKEVRSALEDVARLIPRLEHPHPATSKWVRSHRTVPEENIAHLIALVEQVEVLQRLNTFDIAEARETLQFIQAFRPIADQVAALGASISYTMEARKARVVAAGLRTYAIAKALARDNREGMDVTFALEQLRSVMRRSRARRKQRDGVIA